MAPEPKVVFSLIFSILFSGMVLAGPALAVDGEAPNAVHNRLEKGEVVVDFKNVGKRKYVTGRIIINHRPEEVWPVMVNPFEFKRNIAPRMKALEILSDKINMSIQRVTVDAFPIPPVTYTVKSTYERTDNGSKIEFWRVAGMIKDFRGHWIMRPCSNGQKTELSYSMYIDPGFYVPQWIVRQCVKGELPKTLLALRKRVEEVCSDVSVLEKQTIMAALPLRKVADTPGHHI